MHEVLGDQLILAALSSCGIEALKNSKYFPLITTQTEQLNKIFAAAVAALATAGILVTANWDPTAHTFTFAVANLTAMSVLSFVWHWFGQYIYMKIAYKGMKALGNGGANGKP